LKGKTGQGRFKKGYSRIVKGGGEFCELRNEWNHVRRLSERQGVSKNKEGED